MEEVDTVITVTDQAVIIWPPRLIKSANEKYRLPLSCFVALLLE